MANLSQFIRQNFSNNNWSKDLDAIALNDDRIRDIEENFPHLGRNYQLLVLFAFSNMHPRFQDKWKPQVESVFLQALNAENSMVKSVATILFSKHTLGYLTFDISLTHDSFEHTIVQLLQTRSTWGTKGEPLNAAFLCPWVLGRQYGSAKLQTGTELTAFKQRKSKSRSSLAKEAYLEKLRNVGNKKCSVPLVMRSFRKRDEEDMASSPEPRPPVSRRTPFAVGGRTPLGGHRDSGPAGDANPTINRLPGSQVRRCPNKKDVGIKMISLEDLPPVGMRAKQLKREAMDVERDLKRKEKEDRRRESLQEREEAKMHKMRERQNLADARRLQEQLREEELARQEEEQTASSNHEKIMINNSAVKIPRELVTVAVKKKQPPVSTLNPDKDDEVNSQQTSTLVQLPPIRLSATVQEQHQQLIQLQKEQSDGQGRVFTVRLPIGSQVSDGQLKTLVLPRGSVQLPFQQQTATIMTRPPPPSTTVDLDEQPAPPVPAAPPQQAIRIVSQAQVQQPVQVISQQPPGKKPIQLLCQTPQGVQLVRQIQPQQASHQVPQQTTHQVTQHQQQQSIGQFRLISNTQQPIAFRPMVAQQQTQQQQPIQARPSVQLMQVIRPQPGSGQSQQITYQTVQNSAPGSMILRPNINPRPQQPTAQQLPPVAAPVASHTPGGGDVVQLNTGLWLTRDQMVNVQNIFRDANKVTRPEKGVILNFLAGSRANPTPDLGPQVRIHLSEYRELVQDQLSQQRIEVAADTFFQMDYSSGQWDTVKRYRKVTPEVLAGLHVAPASSQP